MWVKICGNTNLDDALMAADLGADAVGFVFAPSKRQVTAEQVAQIVERLPPHLETVGVFPAWDAQQIEAVVRVSGVTTAQLHGGYRPLLTRNLQELFVGALRIIEVTHWEVGFGQTGSVPPGGRVLVDSKVGVEMGGTGKTFAWESARELFASQRQMILAGGLSPINVYQAIQTLQPWGVDVVSGVEAFPGQKDRTKMSQFFRQIRPTP